MLYLSLLLLLLAELSFANICEGFNQTTCTQIEFTNDCFFAGAQIGCITKRRCERLEKEKWCNRKSYCSWENKKCIFFELADSSDSSDCASLPNKKACLLNENCTFLDNVHVCDFKSDNCVTYNYGCQQNSFCDFEGLYPKKQCFSNLNCVWNYENRTCTLAGGKNETLNFPSVSPSIKSTKTRSPKTFSPGIRPTKTKNPTPSFSSCDSAETSQECADLGEACDWFIVTVCDEKSKSCQKNSYGCQNALTFCDFSKGRSQEKQCKQNDERCSWDPLLLKCYFPNNATTPTAFPSISPNTTPSPSTRHVSKSPSVFFTTSPSKFPTFNGNLTSSCPSAQDEASCALFPVCNWKAGTCLPKCEISTDVCEDFTFVAATVNSRLTRFAGETKGDETGFSVAGDGDFDGDSIPDFVIGSPNYFPILEGRDGVGRVNLLLSSSNYFFPPASSSGKRILLTKNVFSIVGNLSEGKFGSSAVFVDLDADGLDDLVVGAPYASPEGLNRAGKIYIIWGQKNFTHLWQSNAYDGIETSQLVTGISGDTSLMTFGSALGRAGDFDGDGIQDLIVSGSDASVAPGRGRGGVVYILFGSKNRSSFSDRPLKISSYLKILPRHAFSFLGTSVAGDNRDFNGDSISDIVIGAPWAKSGTGQSFVVFGRPRKGTVASEMVIDLLTDSYLLPSKGWNFLVLEAAASASKWSNFGQAVSIAGDINLDGYDDIVIGAPRFSLNSLLNQEGRAYVFYGRSIPIQSLSVLDLNGINGKSALVYLFMYAYVVFDNITGFAIAGTQENEEFGSSVLRGFADINGDKIPDIVIGSPKRTTLQTTEGGQLVIIYGQCSQSFPSIITSQNVRFTSQVKGFQSFANLGSSVCSCGDLNRDGTSDLLFGGYSVDDSRGNAYMYSSCT